MSTTGCCFCFGSISLFFLELFLHWYPVACWAPTHLGSSSFSVLSFCLFIPLVRFSRQEYWSGLPFPSPVDHILSPPWPICLGWPYTAWLSFIDLDKSVIHMIRFVSFLWLCFSFCCSLMEKDQRLRKLPDGRDWLKGKLDLVLTGGARLSKSLIQFSVDGWSCDPFLLFTWGQTMVEVMKIMATSFKRSHARTATLSALNPAAGLHQPTPLLETPGPSRASLVCSQVTVCWTPYKSLPYWVFAAGIGKM